MRHLLTAIRSSEGQVLVEFSLVIFILVLILFSILEGGLVMNAQMALSYAARETARVCSIEGGRSEGALLRLEETLRGCGIDFEDVAFDISPKQAIYGTTIRVQLVYEYRVLSPVMRGIAGESMHLTAKAVTRSEYVPR